MSNTLNLIGSVGRNAEISLKSIIELVGMSDKTKPLEVFVHSPGGEVFEGKAIYKFFKELGKTQQVNMHSLGMVASIASIFFLAGTERTGHETDDVLIHLPKGGVIGTAEDLEKSARELRDMEDELAEIYAVETSFTKQEALDLMKNDEMVNVDLLKEKGFFTEVKEFKAVATFNKYKMGTEAVTKKEVQSLFEKFENKMKGFFNKNEPENKVVKDATGVNIDFADLKKDEEVLVGAEATIDNKKANGEFTMPDGNKWTFVNGKLDTILKEETDLEKLQAENSTLKDELQTAAVSLQEKTDELATKETMMATLQDDFTTFKGEITSKFSFDGKTNRNGAEHQNMNEQGAKRTPIKK